MTNPLTVPLAAVLLVLAITLGFLVGRTRETCASTSVNGLACVECHRGLRTTITCAPRAVTSW